jgi:hypothetical protein
MQKELAITDRKPYEQLAAAAEAIRHGDVPLRRSARHPVNTARRSKHQLLAYVREIVTRAIDHHPVE